MVQTLAYCFGRVAPYYNLVLAVILLFLFLKLFKIGGKKTDMKPWKFLFMAVLVYLGEEIITVLSMANLIVVPKIIFPLLETIIITLFIYVLLSHKENTKK